MRHAAHFRTYGRPKRQATPSHSQASSRHAPSRRRTKSSRRLSLGTYSLKQLACRLVVWGLRDKFAPEGLGERRSVENIDSRACGGDASFEAVSVRKQCLDAEDDFSLLGNGRQWDPVVYADRFTKKETDDQGVAA